jgi:hypothetical protein
MYLRSRDQKAKDVFDETLGGLLAPRNSASFEAFGVCRAFTIFKALQHKLD